MLAIAHTYDVLIVSDTRTTMGPRLGQSLCRGVPGIRRRGHLGLCVLFPSKTTCCSSLRRPGFCCVVSLSRSRSGHARPRASLRDTHLCYVARDSAHSNINFGLCPVSVLHRPGRPVRHPLPGRGGANRVLIPDASVSAQIIVVGGIGSILGARVLGAALRMWLMVDRGTPKSETRPLAGYWHCSIILCPRGVIGWRGPLGSAWGRLRIRRPAGS